LDIGKASDKQADLDENDGRGGESQLESNGYSHILVFMQNFWGKTFSFE
jgi:hypothetical protein